MELERQLTIAFLAGSFRTGIMHLNQFAGDNVEQVRRFIPVSGKLILTDGTQIILAYPGSRYAMGMCFDQMIVPFILAHGPPQPRDTDLDWMMTHLTGFVPDEFAFQFYGTDKGNCPLCGEENNT